MSALPEGWAAATLDDLGDYLNGMAFKPGDWTETGFPIIRIQNLTNPDRPLNRTERAFDDRYLVRAGDLLISWSATLDAFIWEREDAVLNQHIFKVTPSSAADPKFLFYASRQAISELVSSEHLHGSTMKHINRGPFLAHKLGLPPLAEQRRIVAKLDALTARTARARADLDRIPALAARYKQAVLAKAFSGELTATHPVEPSVAEGPRDYKELGLDEQERGIWKVERLPDGWAWKSFATILDDVTDSRRKLPTKDYRPSGRFPIVDQGEVTVAGFTDREDMVNVSQPPNIVFGDHTRCVKFISERFAQGADGVKVLKPRPSVDPRYAELLLRAVEIPNKGYSRHMKFLRASYFPVCSLAVQREIVRRVDRAFDEIDQLTTEASAARRLLDRLDQAVLAKAFRGELVPQDPDDEPAEVLLDRIRAELAAAPKPSRGRRKAAVK